MMIKKLSRIIISKENDLQTSRPPTNEEMMDKINEIIEYVSKPESKLWKTYKEQ